MAFIQNPTPQAIARGDIGGQFAVFKSGENLDIDTAAVEDIWFTTAATAIYTQLAAAAVHTIVSDNAADTAAGTGARTVKITGLDSLYNEVSETVIMAGLVGVLTVNSYIFVSEVRVLTVGAGEVNAGYITASVAGVVKIGIPIAANFSSFAIYQVPAGYTAFLYNLSVSSNKSCVVSLLVKPFTEVLQVWDEIGLDITSTSLTQKMYQGYIKFTEKTFFKIQVQALANNTRVQASFQIVLQAN